jgi:hypothetical protein
MCFRFRRAVPLPPGFSPSDFPRGAILRNRGVCSIAALFLSRRRRFLPALDADVQGDKNHGVEVDKNACHNLQRIAMMVPNGETNSTAPEQRAWFRLNVAELPFSSALAAFVSRAQAG